MLNALRLSYFVFWAMAYWLHQDRGVLLVDLYVKKQIFLNKLILNPFWCICSLFKALFNRFAQRPSLTVNINSVTSSTNIIQYFAKWYVRKLINHYCSVVPVKISTLGSTFKWEAWQASFPTGAVAPRVGIFLSTVDTNDGFYLSHMPVPAHWKDKKRTATRQPHVDPWRHCDVKMTSPCRTSAYSGFSGRPFHVSMEGLNITT